MAQWQYVDTGDAWGYVAYVPQLAAPPMILGTYSTRRAAECACAEYNAVALADA